MCLVISKIDDTLPQNIASHLKGGIPEADINSLETLENIATVKEEDIHLCR